MIDFFMQKDYATLSVVRALAHATKATRIARDGH